MEDKSPPSKLILIWVLLSKLTVFKMSIERPSFFGIDIDYIPLFYHRKRSFLFTKYNNYVAHNHIYQDWVNNSGLLF